MNAEQEKIFNEWFDRLPKSPSSIPPLAYNTKNIVENVINHILAASTPSQGEYTPPCWCCSGTREIPANEGTHTVPCPHCTPPPAAETKEKECPACGCPIIGRHFAACPVFAKEPVVVPTPDMGKEGEADTVHDAVDRFLQDHEDDVVRGATWDVPDCYVIAEPVLRTFIDYIATLSGRASRKVLTDEDIRKRSLRIAVDFTDLFQKHYPDKPIVEIIELLADEVARAVRDAGGGGVK